MTREEAKELMPLIQAFIEGKTIEFLNNNGKWEELDDIVFCREPKYYRIKQEPKYRPFKTREECWYEISRHSFPQFLLRKEDKLIMTIGYIGTTGVALNKINNGYLFQEMFNYFTFIDGEPFGVKENN